MENYKDPESQEKELKEKISVIEKIPTGVVPRAEVILVLIGEKPATEMYLPDKNNAERAIEDLLNIGLFAEVIENKNMKDGDNSVEIGVAKSREILDELKQTKSNEHHRRYGELMGFPTSAIDAFLGENGAERLSYDEQRILINDLPNVLNDFAFSKQNTEEELAKFKKWLKLIAQDAPELIDQLYSEEDAKRFKEELLK